MTTLIRTALAMAVAAIVCCSHCTAYSAEAVRGPNVVLIFADDQGYGDLHCYGAADLETPNMDRLAREGTRFTSFYVAQPVCTASRAALLTGCYSNRVGMAGALNHTSTVGINPRETLLSETCKAQGYATAIYGKWHLGHQPPFLPTRNGFDEFFGIPYSNDNGPLHPVVRGIPPLPLYDGEEIVEHDPDQSQFTRRLTERAVRFIEKHREQPFFLYLPHIMPHVPIFASDRFRGTSRRGLYGDVIQELDWSVGRILAALETNGLDERTLVIYTSDNGPFLSYGEHAGSAGPLREGKLTTFEGGVREPCLMRWPGKIPAGRVCDEIASTMDLCVTISGLVGAKLPDAQLDGIDLAPLLFGQPGAKGRDVFWYYSGDELHAVRQGDWKLHLPHEYLTVAGDPGKGGKPSNYGKLEPQSIELSGIRGIATRHGYRFQKIGLSLYNLKEDPGETKNVAEQHRDVVDRLQAVAAAARADLGDSLTGMPDKNVRPHGDVSQSQPSGKFFVAGSVFDEETMQPIADAELRFMIDGERDPEKRVRRVSTDATGHFRIEVPVGAVQLWLPELKPGYWLEPAHATTALSTSVERPVAALDIAAKRGRVWPVRITVEGGLPENSQPTVSAMEIEDDATRSNVVNGEPFSFKTSPAQASAILGEDGAGAFTECGTSGKLVVNVAVAGDAALAVKGIATEFVVDPAFQITKVKSVSPIAGTDKVELADERGAKATIGKAKVALMDGQPLLTFHLKRSQVRLQEFAGLAIDEAGKPLSDVHVGTALGSSSASGEWPYATKTDREGRFRLQVPLVESAVKLHLQLVLSKDGYAGYDSRKFGLPKEPVETIDVGQLPLPVGHSVPVRVVNAHGQALAGAVVEPQSDYALRKMAIRTDPKGRGVLRNLPAGVVRVAFSYAGHYGSAQCVVSAVDAENTEIELRLEAPAAPPAVAKPPAKPIAVGQLAPELAIEEWSDGQQHKLADFRGRVVVIDFWGMWCGPCVKSIPAMQQTEEKYAPRDVVFLSFCPPRSSNGSAS